MDGVGPGAANSAEAGAEAGSETVADAAVGALGIEDFVVQKHAYFFKKHMQLMPPPYKSMDTNRLTLLYFCVSGLDLLGMLEESSNREIVEYVYSYMSPLPGHGGFYGYPRVNFESEELDRCNNQPHIANTYCALVMLLILGDDLKRIDRDAVRGSLRKWQLEDGSFCCVHGISTLDSENDIRFVYCAASICFILDLWDAVDVDKMEAFILGARSYDGAFGMGPTCESHGGCTYCALAALSMMGRLPTLPEKHGLIDWCIKRQHFGFQGRIEKPMDSCYSFWVGASLDILGVASFIEPCSCTLFLKRCESTSTGGFQKFPEVREPDLLHSYFSVCGLSLCGLLPPMHAMLNMSQRAFDAAAGGHFRMAPGGASWSPPLPPRPVASRCRGPPGPADERAAPAAAPPSTDVAASAWSTGRLLKVVVLPVLIAILLQALTTFFT